MAEVSDAVPGSQDSDKTIEYSLEGTVGSLSGDTEDHSEKTNSSEGNPVTLNPQAQSNVGEDLTAQGGSAEQGTNKLEKNADSSEEKSVLKEPSNKSNEPDVQESQEYSEEQGGDVSDMEVDDDTGQASVVVESEPKHTTKGMDDGTGEGSSPAEAKSKQKHMGEQMDGGTGQGSSSAKAGSRRKNAAEMMDDDGDDDSDDDSSYGYHWGRSWASKDTREYRSGYQGKRDNPHLNKNYKFYTNQIPSEPDGDLIDTIHAEWKGNYHWLEIHHGYIQWLFPIREHGLNWHAHELQSHEIKNICADPKAHKRILTSYELMLDFYGMKLKDPETGELERAENWQSRFRHLNHSMHNYLRITRILKCLGEFGYEHLKAPFVLFVLHEAIVERTLSNTMNSCMNYWLEVIKDDSERKQIRKYAKTLSPQKN